MPTENQPKPTQLYAALMEEVKIRISAVETALNTPVFAYPALTREFCFLQLRLVCELIALGCLVAHGDIEETTPLRREWSADKILAKLGKLHDGFYPTPVTQKKVEPHNHNLTVITNGFLTKADLLKLYAQTGMVLHRGSLKTLLPPKPARGTSLEDILINLKKIAILLNHHTILMIDKKSMMICMLRNGNDNNRVQVATASLKPLGANSKPPG